MALTIVEVQLLPSVWRAVGVLAQNTLNQTASGAPIKCGEYELPLNTCPDVIR